MRCSDRIVWRTPTIRRPERGQWFDKSAFTAAGQYSDRQQFEKSGTRTRASKCGPDDREDVSPYRAHGFEFRAEVFNVTNTPPLNDPNGSFGSAAFGTITSAGNPRDFEFAGKFRF